MSKTAEVFALADVSESAQRTLLSIATPVHFRKGEWVFREGDHATSLYIVKAGNVAIESHVAWQGSIRLMTLGEGEWFSWSALIEPKIETASGLAIEDSDVYAIRGSDLEKCCQDDPVFGFEIYRELAETIGRRLIHTRLQVLQMLSPV